MATVCVHFPPAEYLKERLTKLTEDSATDDSWLDFADGWIAVLKLRSEMDSERGQAILDCMCLDEDVLIGLGAAEQLSHAVLKEPPTELLKLLKQGPGKHLKKHEYEYRRKIDEELSQIRRIMELQVRAVALIGTALLSLLVGVANFMSRLLYDDMYAGEGGAAGAS